MNIAQIALLAIKQSTKNTELSQAHSNITKKHQPKPLETFIIQRQAPGVYGKLDGARGGGSGGRSAGGRHPDQASGQPGAACAPLGEQAPPPAAAILHSFGRAGFSGFKHPNGIHRWIRIRVVRNHFISTQASRSGLGAARGSTPRFGTQNSLPCIAWRSWRRGRVSPRFKPLPTASSMARGAGAAEGGGGWQAPGPGLGAARGSMRASGRASAASCSRHLAQLREGRIFGV